MSPRSSSRRIAKDTQYPVDMLPEYNEAIVQGIRKGRMSWLSSGGFECASRFPFL